MKVIIGSFHYSELSALKAVKPADKTLTNLSRSVIDQMSIRIDPVLQSLKNKISDIVNHADVTGAKTESICDEIFETDGFVKQFSKFGSNNGFDGVYIKRDASGTVQEILINEAKQVGTVGNIRLNPANPSNGLAAQMSDAWVLDTIRKMQLQSGTIGELGDLLFGNLTKIKKTVTGVERSSSEIIIVKLANY